MSKAGHEIVLDRRCFLYHHRHQTYRRTRPGDDTEILEEMFNKIVRRHGVRATCEHLMEVPDFDFALMASPTWGDLVRRMSTRTEEWIPDERRAVRAA
jgi:hypothetical protein